MSVCISFICDGCDREDSVYVSEQYFDGRPIAANIYDAQFRPASIQAIRLDSQEHMTWPGYVRRDDIFPYPLRLCDECYAKLKKIMDLRYDEYVVDRMQAFRKFRISRKEETCKE